MTLLDLEKRLSEGIPKASPALKTLMLKMKGLPFYHPTKPCFWYQIGAPLTYNGTPSPLWDYQQRIIGTLQTHKLIAVNKCRHSGLTELGLRYFLYMILCEQISGNYLGIAATNLELSRDLARRMKAILAKHSVYFDERETTLTFPHCRVQFFPSNAENLRGYIPAAVLVDEFGHADFTSDIFATIDAFHIKNPQAPIYCITTPGRVGSNAHSALLIGHDLIPEVNVVEVYREDAETRPIVYFVPPDRLVINSKRPSSKIILEANAKDPIEMKARVLPLLVRAGIDAFPQSSCMSKEEWLIWYDKIIDRMWSK